MELEKQFAALEHRGLIPKGERLIPLAGREPENTLIWQARFPNLSAAEAALRTIETNPEHTALHKKQEQFFEDTWVEFFKLLEY